MDKLVTKKNTKVQNNKREHYYRKNGSLGYKSILSSSQKEVAKVKRNKTIPCKGKQNSNGIYSSPLVNQKNSDSTSPGGKTQYRWKKDLDTSSIQKAEECTETSKINSKASICEAGPGPRDNLGNRVVCENSLHAVQSEVVTVEEDKNENSKEAQDVDLKPTRANSLLEQLQDSKSNRMLQSINPELEKIPTDCAFLHLPTQTRTVSHPKKQNGVTGRHSVPGNIPPTKSDASPPKTNGVVRRRSGSDATSQYQPVKNVPSKTSKLNGSTRRSSRTIFTGQMEVLAETDSEGETTGPKRNKSKRKSKSSSVISSEDKSTSEKQSHLHAAVGDVTNNDVIETTDVIKKEKVSSSQCEPVPVSEESGKNGEANTKPQVSPRYLTAVCRNHNHRNSGEKLEAVLFCRLCAQAVCYKCAFERHKDHEVTPLASAADIIRTKMSEQKRVIEGNISQMRGRRKLMESSSEDVRKYMKIQFESVMEKLKEKEEEIMQALDKSKQERLGSLYRMQTQQETSWGQIDAVLKTTDDIKMLEEFAALNTDIIDARPGPPTSDVACLSPILLNPRESVDLNTVQEEIEKVQLLNGDESSSNEMSPSDTTNDTPRKGQKLVFKMDPSTAGTALRISPNCTSVEYVGSARNSVIQHPPPQIHPSTHGACVNHSHPYPAVGATGLTRLRRSQFATVLSNTSITQGKQYWEVSVNRSMEYRLGVAYKHIQGTKTLADEHNSWVMCLTYPDRFSAMHKGHKEYIFIASHVAARTNKVMRIGLFLDFERGILSFYNASNSAEKRHLYTFRTFFNRPVWPLISLRQGKLQILTGLPIPRNLVWKTR